MLMINTSHREEDKWDKIIYAVGSPILETSWDLKSLFFTLSGSCLLFFFSVLKVEEQKGTSQYMCSIGLTWSQSLQASPAMPGELVNFLS